MAGGIEGWVDHPEYRREIARARALVTSTRERWRILYHYDGDGIASASAAIRAFERLGAPTQATPFVGVERERMQRLLERTKTPVMIVDTGASWLDLASAHKEPVVVLDHHQYPRLKEGQELPAHVALVNPLDWDVNGMSELSASSLTWLFTVVLDERNWDNAAFGLSGVIADRQHVGGLKGLNRKLVDEAVRRSLLEPRRDLALYGASTLEALEHGIDPFIAGLSGRPESVRSFLHELGVDPERPPSSLTQAQRERVGKALRERLKVQGARPEFLGVLDQEDWFIPALALTAGELSNLQNATGREEIPGVGVALALGDTEALKSSRAAEGRWRAGILKGLLRLEDHGVNSLKAVQWFESPETTLAGTQAGLAMTYLLDYHRPVFVFSKSTDGRAIKVSGRGTVWLVGEGLDLASACRVAGALVGGEGGGHSVASGATIPLGARDAFLAEADRIVSEQIPQVLEEVSA